MPVATGSWAEWSCGLGAPGLEVLAARPLRVDEISVISGDRAQQLKPLEPRDRVHRVLAGREPRLNLSARTLRANSTFTLPHIVVDGALPE